MADSVITGGSSTGGVEGLINPEAKQIFDDVLNSLSDSDKALLDELAGGTSGTIEVAQIPGTDAKYVQAVNTHTPKLVSDDSTPDPNDTIPDPNDWASGKSIDETVSKLISTPSDSTVFDVPSGDLDFRINLPAGVDLQIQGPAVDVTVFQATEYFGALVEGWIPGESTYKDSFNSAVARAMDNSGDGTSVRLITPGDDSAAGVGNLVLSGSSANETVVINMYGVNAGRIVEIQDFNSTVLLGGGTVNVKGVAGAFVTGDDANQKITGNAGNDTLIGGGGSDVLTGGSGSDVFGVGFDGDTMITDFSAGDKLFFEGSGTLQNFLQAEISTVNLGSFVVTDVASNGHHIYLVGVDPSTLTLDMIKFTI